MIYIVAQSLNLSAVAFISLFMCANDDANLDFTADASSGQTTQLRLLWLSTTLKPGVLLSAY